MLYRRTLSFALLSLIAACSGPPPPEQSAPPTGPVTVQSPDGVDIAATGLDKYGNGAPLRSDPKSVALRGESAPVPYNGMLNRYPSMTRTPVQQVRDAANAIRNRPTVTPPVMVTI